MSSEKKDYKYWNDNINGWVFLSHSSKNYQQVLKIRNYLEETGFNPIMFYLKIFDNESKQDESWKLIKQEIDARNIFVICNSKEANESKWVQKEKEYVKKSENKTYVEIDLDTMEETPCIELSKLDELKKLSTLFFLYSSKDDIVKNIQKELNARGYKIHVNASSYKKVDRGGKNNKENFEKALESVGSRGKILIFLSKAVKDSTWFYKQKDISIKANLDIIPIVLDDVDLEEFPYFKYEHNNIINLHDEFGNVKHINFEGNKEVILNKIIEKIQESTNNDDK